MRMFELVSGSGFHLLLLVGPTVSDGFRCWTFPPPPLPVSLRISLQTLLRGVRLLMEETNCLDPALWMSVVSLSSQRVRRVCQSALFSLQPGSLPPVAGP